MDDGGVKTAGVLCCWGNGVLGETGALICSWREGGNGFETKDLTVEKLLILGRA